jgi:hypothetical protein
VNITFCVLLHKSTSEIVRILEDLYGNDRIEDNVGL